MANDQCHVEMVVGDQWCHVLVLAVVSLADCIQYDSQDMSPFRQYVEDYVFSKESDLFPYLQEIQPSLTA